MIAYLTEKNNTDAELRKRELDLKEQELELQKQRWEIEKEERRQRLNQEMAMIELVQNIAKQ